MITENRTWFYSLWLPDHDCRQSQWIIMDYRRLQIRVSIIWVQFCNIVCESFWLFAIIMEIRLLDQRWMEGSQGSLSTAVFFFYSLEASEREEGRATAEWKKNVCGLLWKKSRFLVSSPMSSHYHYHLRVRSLILNWTNGIWDITCNIAHFTMSKRIKIQYNNIR